MEINWDDIDFESLAKTLNLSGALTALEKLLEEKNLEINEENKHLYLEMIEKKQVLDPENIKKIKCSSKYRLQIIKIIENAMEINRFVEDNLEEIFEKYGISISDRLKLIYARISSNSDLLTKKQQVLIDKLLFQQKFADINKDISINANSESSPVNYKLVDIMNRIIKQVVFQEMVKKDKRYKAFREPEIITKPKLEKKLIEIMSGKINQRLKDMICLELRYQKDIIIDIEECSKEQLLSIIEQDAIPLSTLKYKDYINKMGLEEILRFIEDNKLHNSTDNNNHLKSSIITSVMERIINLEVKNKNNQGYIIDIINNPKIHMLFTYQAGRLLSQDKLKLLMNNEELILSLYHNGVYIKEFEYEKYFDDELLADVLEQRVKDNSILNINIPKEKVNKELYIHLGGKFAHRALRTMFSKEDKRIWNKDVSVYERILTETRHGNHDNYGVFHIYDALPECCNESSIIKNHKIDRYIGKGLLEQAVKEIQTMEIKDAYNRIIKDIKKNDCSYIEKLTDKRILNDSKYILPIINALEEANQLNVLPLPIRIKVVQLIEGPNKAEKIELMCIQKETRELIQETKKKTIKI